MTLEGISLEDLEKKLFRLSEERFLELVQHSEALQRQTDDASMLDALRPRLVRERPPRAYTVRRLLCLPFEDLLADKGRSGEWGTRIARESIMSLWEILKPGLDPELVKSLSTRLRELPRGNTSKLPSLGHELFAPAHQALVAWLQSPAAQSSDHKQAEPGTASLLDTIKDVAALLALADPLLRLKRVLAPAPIAKLSTAHVEAIRNILDDLPELTSEEAILLFSVGAARMSKPTDILDILEKLLEDRSHKQSAALVTGMSRAAYGDLDEACAKLVDAVDGTQTQQDGLDVVDDAVKLAQDLLAIQRVTDRRRGVLPEGHLEQPVRTIAKVLMDVAIEDADKEIVDKLEKAFTGGGDQDSEGQLNEDGMDPHMIEVERRAMALRKCAKVAETLGIHKEVKQQRTKIVDAVEQSTRHMLNEVERGGVEPTERSAKETQLFNAVRTLELVEGPGRAADLLNKGTQAIDNAFRDSAA